VTLALNVPFKLTLGTKRALALSTEDTMTKVTVSSGSMETSGIRFNYSKEYMNQIMLRS